MKSGNTQAVTPFNFEGANIRIVSENDKLWFIAKDICDVLKISNVTDALLKLDDEEKATLGLTESHAGQGAQSYSVVSESGMYTLVLRSRDAVKKGSPAHRFRKWVTSKVLPTIRKTGRYELPRMTAEQTGAIYHAAQRRVAELPKAAQKGGYPQLYGALKAHFQVASYKDIPPAHFDAALAFIKSYYFPAVTAEIEGPAFADLPDGLFVLGVENGLPLFLRSLREENIALAVAKLETEMYGFQDRLRSLSVRLGFDFAKQKHCGERDFLMREA